MSSSNEPRCAWCGEPLEDGDVCRACAERGEDEAYQRGYKAGYSKGFEEGKEMGRREVYTEIEHAYWIPYEKRMSLIRQLMYG